MESIFKKHIKQISLLIDPGKLSLDDLIPIVDLGILHGIDFFFIGGSLMSHGILDETLDLIKSKCNIPCILYPGSTYQISNKADACLFMSLVSGRNPEYLIGQQVVSAPLLKRAKIKTISTAYMLVSNCISTSVAYMSQTFPIPTHKTDIALATALAADMLGFSCIFIDAGSGAEQEVPAEAIREISKHINKPLLVGGGINTPEKLIQAFSNGADIVVVGNAIEENPSLIKDLVSARNKFTNKNSQTTS